LPALWRGKLFIAPLLAESKVESSASEEESSTSEKESSPASQAGSSAASLAEEEALKSGAERRACE